MSPHMTQHEVENKPMNTIPTKIMDEATTAITFQEHRWCHIGTSYQIQSQGHIVRKKLGTYHGLKVQLWGERTSKITCNNKEIWEHWLKSKLSSVMLRIINNWGKKSFERRVIMLPAKASSCFMMGFTYGTAREHIHVFTWQTWIFYLWPVFTKSNAKVIPVQHIP